MYTRYDDQMTYDRDGGVQPLRSIAYKKMPNVTIFKRDSLGNNTDQYFNETTLQGGPSSVYNPIALAKLATNNRIRDNARALFNLRYVIIPGLVLNSTITLDIFDSKQEKFLPVEAIGGSSNSASNGFSKKSSVFTKNQMVYTPKLGKNHELSVIGQYDTETTVERSLNVSTNSNASKYIQQTVGDKQISSISSSLNRNRALGAYVSANYKLYENYIFMVGAKAEGTSRFSSKSRWGVFPTASVAWRVSGEPFLKNSKAITDLKLRASWGQSGNKPYGNYLYFNNYESNAGLNYMDIKGTKPSSMELTSLKWETIEQVNLGFDLSLFKEALSVVFDVYQKKTHDLFLMGTGIPITSGFGSLSINNGEMENRGIELAFNSTFVRTQNFQFDMNVNFSKNQNIVTKLPESYSFTQGDVTNNGEYLMKVVTGQPLGGFYGYKYLGVYQYTSDAVAKDENGNPILGLDGYPLKMQMGNKQTEKYTFIGGDAKYEDVNHDGKIDILDVKYLGDLNPKYMGGGGTNIRYKNLSISTFFSFKYGSKIINKTRMMAENMSGFDNQTKATQWRWRQEGNKTDVPRALWTGSDGANPYGYNWLGSDRFVEDGSFIRFKTASLIYNFNKKFTDKIKVKELKLYVTGYNLYTWTKYSGQDPDVAPPGSPTSLPQDNNLTPPSIRLLLGVNVTF
jgi:TonB-linked SusC/RagA family outer membrane protein